MSAKRGILGSMQGAEFFLLGPVEIRAGDAPVPIGGLLSRCVLAVLLLEANRAVSIEQIVIFWPVFTPLKKSVGVHMAISASDRQRRHCVLGKLVRIGTFIQETTRRLHVAGFDRLHERRPTASWTQRAHISARAITSFWISEVPS